MTPVTVPALLLRAHPWSESSHVLRFLTPEHGVVAMLARGVRSRASRGVAPLESFARGELELEFRPGRDLQGFRDFRPEGGEPRKLGRDLLPLAAASWLAELVLAHALEEGSEALFHQVVAGLEALEEAPLEALPGALLGAGWGILAVFGFPPEVERCVACGGGFEGVGVGALARLDLEEGGVRCPGCAGSGDGGRLGPGALADLQALVAGRPPVPLTGAAVHFAYLDRFALHHLGLSRPMRSSALLASLLGAAR